MKPDTDDSTGSTQERHSPRPGLEWDGTQFLPPSAPPDDSPHAAEYRARIDGIEPDAWFPVLAYLMGVLSIGFGLLPIVFRPKDVIGDAIGAAAGVLGLGLIIWGRLEQIRIRPLPRSVLDKTLAERLALTLRFTPDNLASNRLGRLSIRQRLRIVGFDAGWWLTVLVCAGLVAVPFGIAGGRDPVKDVRGLLFVVLGLYALWQAIGSLIDAVRGRVRTSLTTLQAVVQPSNWVSDLVRNWYDSTAHYAYQANDGGLFKVSRAAFEALAPGRQYRVFFTPISKRLMSIEPADD